MKEEQKSKVPLHTVQLSPAQLRYLQYINDDEAYSTLRNLLNAAVFAVEVVPNHAASTIQIALAIVELLDERKEMNGKSPDIPFVRSYDDIMESYYKEKRLRNELAGIDK